MSFHGEKLEKIVELFQTQSYWKSADLAHRLQTSQSTIQRCLKELHAQGLLERVHGGARRTNSAAPIELSRRRSEDRPAKETIAALAANLLPATGTIYLDAGTTLMPLLNHLGPPQPNRVFVTNDIAVATQLAQTGHPHTLLGGRLHTVTQTLSGPVSQSQLAEYHFDLCLISVNGIDPELIATCSLIDEALLKRQAIQQSHMKVLAAAAGKWGRHAGAAVAALDQFDIWLCETAHDKITAACRAHNVRLITP